MTVDFQVQCHAVVVDVGAIGVLHADLHGETNFHILALQRLDADDVDVQRIAVGERATGAQAEHQEGKKDRLETAH